MKVYREKELLHTMENKLPQKWLIDQLLLLRHHLQSFLMLAILQVLHYILLLKKKYLQKIATINPPVSGCMCTYNDPAPKGGGISRCTGIDSPHDMAVRYHFIKLQF